MKNRICWKTAYRTLFVTLLMSAVFAALMLLQGVDLGVLGAIESGLAFGCLFSSLISPVMGYMTLPLLISWGVCRKDAYKTIRRCRLSLLLTEVVLLLLPALLFRSKLTVITPWDIGLLGLAALLIVTVGGTVAAIMYNRWGNVGFFIGMSILPVLLGIGAGVGVFALLQGEPLPGDAVILHYLRLGGFTALAVGAVLYVLLLLVEARACPRYSVR